MSILIREPGYVVQETVAEYDDMVEREPEEVDGKTVKVEIAGNIISLVENIDNEVSHPLGLADDSSPKPFNIPMRTIRGLTTSRD